MAKNNYTVLPLTNKWIAKMAKSNEAWANAWELVQVMNGVRKSHPEFYTFQRKAVLACMNALMTMEGLDLDALYHQADLESANNMQDRVNYSREFRYDVIMAYLYKMNYFAQTDTTAADTTATTDAVADVVADVVADAIIILDADTVERAVERAMAMMDADAVAGAVADAVATMDADAVAGAVADAVATMDADTVAGAIERAVAGAVAGAVVDAVAGAIERAMAMIDADTVAGAIERAVASAEDLPVRAEIKCKHDGCNKIAYPSVWCDEHYYAHQIPLQNQNIPYCHRCLCTTGELIEGFWDGLNCRTCYEYENDLYESEQDSANSELSLQKSALNHEYSWNKFNHPYYGNDE